MMMCANCGLSNNNNNLDNQIHKQILVGPRKNPISVQTALSTIYKLQYLTPMTFSSETSEEEDMAACRQCADVLAQLCKLYIDFNQLRTLDSILSTKIMELDNRIEQQQHQLLQLPVTQDWSPVTSFNSPFQQQQENDIPIVIDDSLDPHFEEVGNFPETVIHSQQQQLNEVETSPLNSQFLEHSSKQQDKQVFVVKLDVSLPPGPWVKLVRLRPEEIPVNRSQAVTLESNENDQPTTEPPVFTDVVRKNFGGQYRCPVCSKECGTRPEFRRHIDCDHRTELLPCPHCQKLLKDRTMLIHHLTSTAHRPKTFVCDECPKTFGRPNDLQRHLAVHTNVRTHLCQLCGRAFSNNPGLKRHLQRHSSEKPFVCKVCHRGFHVVGNLRDHEKIHSGVKRYLCPTCGKNFAQPQGLSYHLRWHRQRGEVVN